MFRVMSKVSKTLMIGFHDLSFRFVHQTNANGDENREAKGSSSHGRLRQQSYLTERTIAGRGLIQRLLWPPIY